MCQLQYDIWESHALLAYVIVKLFQSNPILDAYKYLSKIFSAYGFHDVFIKKYFPETNLENVLTTIIDITFGYL